MIIIVSLTDNNFIDVPFSVVVGHTHFFYMKSLCNPINSPIKSRMHGVGGINIVKYRKEDCIVLFISGNRRLLEEKNLRQ